MTDRGLGEPEPLAGSRQASQVPDRKKDTQEIEVETRIHFAHETNYNYEFDLDQCERKMTAPEL
jgi:hypothetical protein